jgi:phytoene dehydrogenase-like protein
MKAQLTQTDVVVIGGGLAGLSVACYLARAGVAVTLFEKASELGGRASTQVYDGYYFNRGAHALYCGGAAELVLQELGITYSSGQPRKVFLLKQGRLHLLPKSISTLLRSSAFGWKDKLELARVLSTVSRLNAPEFSHLSCQQWLESTIRRPLVRQFMATFACTGVYSSALDLVSAEVLINRTQLAASHPILYINGGWKTLVEGLRSAVERAGGRIVSSARVEAVEHSNGRVRGVRLQDGRFMQASAVIIATNPQDAVRLVDGGAYEPLRQIVDALIPARIACLDVALSHLPDPTHPVVQDMEHPRFLTAQSLYSRIAPEGGALIHTFKQLDPRHPSDPREDERDLEDLLDTAQPGWREVLVKRIYLPRIEAAGMLPTASGGGYAGRPGPQVAGLANLYQAGDWIGSGFLADASMGSARQVAQLLLQQDSPLRTEKVAMR